MTAISLCYLASACSLASPEEEFPPSELPCGEPAQTVLLGTPLRERQPALFSVDGRSVWASFGSGTPASGIFDEVDEGTVSLGHQDVPPSYDATKGVVEGEELQVVVYVGRYTPLDLRAGDYWALHSVGVGDLTLYSCEPDVIFVPE